ncbi:MAG: hypothetical protein Q9191_006609 [Dirinaria sp. TL-2023a]
MIYTNGSFPGPPLIVDYGDFVTFVVHNQMPFDTSVHFHGIEQLGTPWSDGVPGVSQKPIPSGGSFTYKWSALQSGAYWYHGHAKGQVQDGLYGPIYIRPPPNAPQPFSQFANGSQDLAAMKKADETPRLVMLSDWDHLTSDEYLAAEQASNLDTFCVDSMLVNGKGSVNCQPQSLLNNLTLPPLLQLLNGSFVSDRGCTPPVQKALDEGNFTSDITKLPPGLIDGCKPTNGSQEIIEVDAKDGYVSIHWISAMSIKTPVVSIDEHPMCVFAVDGQYIQPQPADTIFMYNGERFAAMVKLDKPPGDYTIRVANSGADQLISGYATLRVKGNDSTSTSPTPASTSTPYINYAGGNVSASVIPLDETKLVPFPASKPAPTADATHFLKFGRLNANWEWTLSGNGSYPETADYQQPLLFYPNSTDAHNSSLVFRTKNGTWVDVVMQVVLNAAAPAQPAHPIHKHSNKAYIIGAGNGVFNYSSVADAIQSIPGSFNLETPSLRDSFATPSVLQGPAWVVFRYQSINPGAFYVHCHIQTHLTGGMAMTILDGVDVWPEVPPEYQI